MTTRSRALARAAGFVLAVAGFVGAPLATGAATATAGSVPLVVANYASDGLLSRLDDLFGVGANGSGIDFGTHSKVGEVDRVFTWRSEFMAGATDGSPVKLTNEWTATITIADKPVGVATIWMNPQNNRPDLADFTRGASVGAAFAGLAAGTTLVHDAANSAWFTLTDKTLAPLVTGNSGVTTTTTLGDYQRRLVTAATNPPKGVASTNQGATNSIIVVAVAVLAVIALVVLTGRRRLNVADAAASAPAEHAATPATKSPGAPRSARPKATTARSGPAKPTVARRTTATTTAKPAAIAPKPEATPKATTPKSAAPAAKQPKPTAKPSAASPKNAAPAKKVARPKPPAAG